MAQEQGRPGPDDGHAGSLGANAATDTGEVAGQARDAGNEALSQAQDRAESGKNRAAEGVDHAADAVRGAAERLKQQEPWLADLVSRGAEELAQLSDALRTNDLRSMLGRAEDLSRRQPMLVAGAAFAAGFAAMRAVRSAAAPAAEGLSDVAGEAMAAARRETSHAMAGARQAAGDIGGNRSEPQQSGSWDDSRAETRRTGLEH